MSKPRTIAVTWFREEDWPVWAAMDPLFDTSHARWLAKMNAQLPLIERRGIEVVKVEMDPNAFTAWAKASGKGHRQTDRAAYAAFVLMRRRTGH